MVRRRQTVNVEVPSDVAADSGGSLVAGDWQLEVVLCYTIKDGKTRWNGFLRRVINNGVESPVPADYTETGAIYDASESEFSERTCDLVWMDFVGMTTVR